MWFCYLVSMEKNKTPQNRHEAFANWLFAKRANVAPEVLSQLWETYRAMLAHETVRIDTAYRRNGRVFRVAVYADGTTADLD
mgnify:CR=1 FL=1